MRKKLIIVAPERFLPALGDYVEHKKNVTPTELVGLEKIISSTPGV